MSATLIDAKENIRIIDLIRMDKVMGKLIDELTIAIEQHSLIQTQVMVRNGFVYPEPTIGMRPSMPFMPAEVDILAMCVAYNPSNSCSFLSLQSLRELI
jgi:hypothetical protein